MDLRDYITGEFLLILFETNKISRFSKKTRSLVFQRSFHHRATFLRSTAKRSAGSLERSEVERGGREEKEEEEEEEEERTR